MARDVIHYFRFLDCRVRSRRGVHPTIPEVTNSVGHPTTLQTTPNVHLTHSRVTSQTSHCDVIFQAR